jgi:hypothetical protein
VADNKVAAFDPVDDWFIVSGPVIASPDFWTRASTYDLVAA